MSIKVMTRVWEHSKHKSTKLLLLLAIADHVNDERGHAFPSIDHLSGKCRITRRQVFRLLRELERSEELTIEKGTGWNPKNYYTITV